jgi:hypothetical protein
MPSKYDPLQGLNPDQTGPKEKIQNGDPRSAPNRDQRSGCAESGGPMGSLQKGLTGTKKGMVPKHHGLKKTVGPNSIRRIPGVKYDQDAAGALDRAGTGSIEQEGTLRDATPMPGGGGGRDEATQLSAESVKKINENDEVAHIEKKSKSHASKKKEEVD